MTTKRTLPKYCYARGNKIWSCLKDETGTWINRPTEYTIDQVEQARRYVATLVRGYAAQRAAQDVGMLTVRKYALRWVTEREKRGVGSAAEERSRLETHVFPQVVGDDATQLGDIEISSVHPRHARDLVRGLRALKTDEGRPALAPRTIIHIYSLVHTMFEGAVVDEYITSNPIKLKSGELPKKVDADPEWRINATYTLDEVQALLSDARIPPERRVTYALKALAGLRHGEAAALCWRHWDAVQEPLTCLNIVQSYCSKTRKIKSTKTGEVRSVPVHGELARILAAWRQIWHQVYGRAPDADDHVVPARTLRPVHSKDAGDAFERDLLVLGLRTKAGTRRKRGGHDLRAWFTTRLIEDDADSMIVQRTTHATDKTVTGGYKRFSWMVLCREVAKLHMQLPVGDPLPLLTSFLQSQIRSQNRWRKVVTPSGLEAKSRALASEHNSDYSSGSASAGAHARAQVVSDSLQSMPPFTQSDDGHDGLVAADRAMQRGDYDLAHAIIRRMRARTAA